jgi:photosystem II stability/assembly factor-like uncharacterized protein
VIREISTVGASTAWVFAGQAGDELFRTSDAGRSWTDLGHSPLGELSFVTPSRGWGVRSWGYPTALVATVDGGASWQRVNGPCGKDQYFDSGVAGWGRVALAYVADVSFVSAATGWVLCEGEAAMGDAPIGVFETTDGGDTWVRRSASIDENPGGIQFIEDGPGWFWPDGIARLMTSVDGGATWRPLGALRPGLTAEGFSLWFTPSSVGYAVEGRALLRSVDGGDTWHRVGNSFL